MAEGKKKSIERTTPSTSYVDSDKKRSYVHDRPLLIHHRRIEQQTTSTQPLAKTLFSRQKAPSHLDIGGRAGRLG